MGKFIVKGGKPLFGEIAVAGAKNAASKMFVASLLTEEPCIFKSVPAIGELEIVVELLRSIGSRVEIAGPTASVSTPEIKNNRVIQLSRRNRIPILALGPLLARTGEAEVPFLGGDKIGPRPVDIHLAGLEKLGAHIEATETSYHAWAPDGLHGAEIELRFPSVGATENILLAATLAKGKTVIKNAALEPEIIDLIKLLQKMGAIIELQPPRTIMIEGVPRLHGATQRVMPDRNEAVSFACLAIATNGRIKLKGAVQEHLITFLNAARRLGGEYEVDEDGIAFWRAQGNSGNSSSGADGGKGILLPLDIRTDVHPGFMTDWQQPLAVLLTQAHGTSTIHETIYEDRFAYVNDLNQMGANIKVSAECPPNDPCRFAGKGLNHFATIVGPTPLESKNLIVRDLRSGMLDILAALVATGVSEIDGVEEIDRGYEIIDARLRQLGAEIIRV
jgi:UDP-N-acetylglucosamine 1-carboxyvinyltransferase